MIEMINKVMFYFKLILLLLVFTLTLYILFSMYDYYKTGFWNLILISLPLLLSLIMFVLSFFFKVGDDKTLFNVGCILALIAILIIDYRSIFDKNMVLWVKGKINFYYFQNQITQIKILCYSIFIGNLVLFYQKRYLIK